MPHSKRHRENETAIDSAKRYSIDEALEVLLGSTGAKFDESVEIAIRLGVDPKKPDQAVRGTLSLPNGIGKTLRVVVFAEGEQAEQAIAAGADDAGGAELIEKVKGGWFDFDVAIAVPAMMRHVGQLGRVLGPKGLMPSPKSGTVTNDIDAAVAEFKAGKIEFRTDKGGNVHAPVGKRSFPVEDLKENIQAFVDQIHHVKPAAARGRYILSATLSTSMGPGVRLAI
ncbi:50S ribosomal protein L1 [bacterium]|nr:50S ribosomal protein L1 [bacterium]